MQNFNTPPTPDLPPGAVTASPQTRVLVPAFQVGDIVQSSPPRPEQSDPIQEMQDPRNILDLKARYDHLLERARDERTFSFYDGEPFGFRPLITEGDPANLRDRLIDEYTQIGASPDNPRKVDQKVWDRIKSLMSLSYEELESLSEHYSPSQEDDRPSEQDESAGASAEEADKNIDGGDSILTNKPINDTMDNHNHDNERNQGNMSVANPNQVNANSVSDIDIDESILPVEVVPIGPVVPEDGAPITAEQLDAAPQSDPYAKAAHVGQAAARAVFRLQNAASFAGDRLRNGRDIVVGAAGVVAEGARRGYNASVIAKNYVTKRAQEAWDFIGRARQTNKREAFLGLFRKARSVGAAAINAARNVQTEARHNVVEAKAHFFGNIKAGQNATPEQAAKAVENARKGLIAAGDSARRRAAARREHVIRDAAELAARAREGAGRVVTGTANAARKAAVATVDARHEAGALVHDAHAAVRSGLGKAALTISNGISSRANVHVAAAEAASDKARKARSKKSNGQPHYTQPTLF